MHYASIQHHNSELSYIYDQQIKFKFFKLYVKQIIPVILETASLYGDNHVFSDSVNSSVPLDLRLIAHW